jgi:hypothetical protein
MGGGRTNGKQADASNTAANQATNQSIDLSKSNQKDASNIQNMFFGSGGKGGSLSGFLDPKSLDAVAPTGAYADRYNEGVRQSADQLKNAQQNTIRQAANRGLGLDSPAVAEMARRNNLDSANSRGHAFSDAVSAQHDEALQNFWGSTNVASQIQGQARSGALEGAGNAGQTQANLYGSASNYHQGAGAQIAGSAIGAAGAVGAAAACPAEGSKILTDSGFKPIEFLRAGDAIATLGGKYAKLKVDPIPYDGISSVIVEAAGGFKVHVSDTHTFALDKGYIFAQNAKPGKQLQVVNGVAPVTIKRYGGDVKIYRLVLDDESNHSYNVDGVWSLE